VNPDEVYENATHTTNVLRDTFFGSPAGREAFRIVMDVLKFGRSIQDEGDVALHNAALELFRLAGVHDPANPEYWEAASVNWRQELKGMIYRDDEDGRTGDE